MKNKPIYLVLLFTFWLGLLVFLIVIMKAQSLWFFSSKTKSAPSSGQDNRSDKEFLDLAREVTPETGIILPIEWNDLSQQLINNGIIDQSKIENLYKEKGIFSPDISFLIESNKIDEIKITKDNANVLLNLLWAFGLSNSNPILETGPMSDPTYGETKDYASTGGWTLAQGNAMEYYSKYNFVVLNAEQQKLVEEVAKNIYRPCCDNSTYFPDCNHGMAMLGLLELLAANNIKEDEMYQVALKVNSYWFPSYYPVIAKYMKTQGTSWDHVNPKEILSKKYSGASGYKRIEAKVMPSRSKGSSCST